MEGLLNFLEAGATYFYDEDLQTIFTRAMMIRCLTRRIAAWAGNGRAVFAQQLQRLYQLSMRDLRLIETKKLEAAIKQALPTDYEQSLFNRILLEELECEMRSAAASGSRFVAPSSKVASGTGTTMSGGSSAVALRDPGSGGVTPVVSGSGGAGGDDFFRLAAPAELRLLKRSFFASRGLSSTAQIKSPGASLYTRPPAILAPAA